MPIRCTNCGRIVHKGNCIHDGEFYFCGPECLGLYVGHALEDELSDLEDEWNEQQSDD